MPPYAACKCLDDRPPNEFVVVASYAAFLHQSSFFMGAAQPGFGFGFPSLSRCRAEVVQGWEFWERADVITAHSFAMHSVMVGRTDISGDIGFIDYKLLAYAWLPQPAQVRLTHLGDAAVFLSTADLELGRGLPRPSGAICTSWSREFEVFS